MRNTHAPAMPRLLPLLAAVALAACGDPAPAGPAVEEGSLDASDETLTTGEFADIHTVRVGEGQWLSVRLDAEGFDPYLILNAPGGAQYEIDDSDEGDTESVRTALRVDESGTWQVRVTTYEPGETGTYRLTTESTLEEPVGAGPAPELTSIDGETPVEAPGDEEATEV